MRKILLFLLGLGIFWSAGFAWFYVQVPMATTYQEAKTPTDMIVVLTGGIGRLERGIRLLNENKANILFISGVGRDVKFRELAATFGIDTSKPEQVSGHKEIVLDYVAHDTIGNAEETAKWIRKNNIRSFRLVTSSYHMPRSLLEFRHLLPDTIILPSPVFPREVMPDESFFLTRGSSRLILLEYHKYLFRKIFLSLGLA